MELPTNAFVTCGIMNLSQTPGTLMAIRPEGCYEVRLTSQGKSHVVLLPITATCVVIAEPEPEFESVEGIER
jgi:hypothetical protein